MPVWQARVRMPGSYTRQKRHCPASLRADPPRLQATPCESSTCLGLMPSPFLRPGYVVCGTLPYVVAKGSPFCIDFSVLNIRAHGSSAASRPIRQTSLPRLPGWWTIAHHGEEIHRSTSSVSCTPRDRPTGAGVPTRVPVVRDCPIFRGVGECALRPRQVAQPWHLRYSWPTGWAARTP